MALKHSRGMHWMAIAVCAAAWGCRGSEPAPAPPTAPEPLSATRWTDTTELFVEYPALVVGQTSRFAIHLTRLEPFKAVADGAVEVQLRGASGDVESFRAQGPSRPGIFGVDVRPARAGTRELVIILRATGLADEQRVGAVDVHADAGAARAAVTTGPETEGVTFLKEQQWALDFGTGVVSDRALRESIRIPAEIRPRTGGSANVVAPIAGRLTFVADLEIGAPVSRGQEIARVSPPAATPGDLPALERARVDTAAAHALATRDRERAERLLAAGAAPQRRLDEARTAETRAAATLQAAEAQLAQYNNARTAGGGSESGLFSIRAPLTGVIGAREATSGSNVSAGTSLFHIVDAALVNVVGQVPERDAARARRVTGAELEVPGRDALLPAGPMTAIGKVLDGQSRSLPIVFTLDNRAFGLPLGQTAFLHLLMQDTARAPVIPMSAVVDDAGRPIVFVQVEGEKFERRPVTLGAREGSFVQAISGVKPGERVVTRGAYLVRLASLSTQVPAHGHVH